MSIEIFPLGAGREVGRSCVIVKIAHRTVMFDCGMHMGYEDSRKFPDFTAIAQTQDYTEHIDCVLITHFHLDHCGALPYFTEIKGYSGPVLMSGPTRAILPLMLEDLRKVSVEHKREQNFFTKEMIKACCAKISTIELHQTLQLKDMKITAYYAGHVLGAVMFHIECCGFSALYTGDYNVAADRHLRGAWVERLDANVIITESTYATKFRELKMRREKLFLKKVLETVERGGKVLIPVFALGRAQELCILLDTYWERAQLDVPIHFAGTLTSKANQFYKIFINWCNENVQQVFLQRNMFDFQHITPFDRVMIRSKDPLVLLATPGMLHGGLSLSVFKEWCEDSKNTVIIPGYCVAGTVGHALLCKRGDSVLIDNKEYAVNCEIKAMSFSAHTDHKGILQVIRWVNPDNVVLVHGEEKRMRGLAGDIQKTMQLPCFMPGNLEKLLIHCELKHDLFMDFKLFSQYKKEVHQELAAQLLGNHVNTEVTGTVGENHVFEREQNVLFSMEITLSQEVAKKQLAGLSQVLAFEPLGSSCLLTWQTQHDGLVSEELKKIGFS